MLLNPIYQLLNVFPGILDDESICPLHDADSPIGRNESPDVLGWISPQHSLNFGNIQVIEKDRLGNELFL